MPTKPQPAETALSLLRERSLASAAQEEIENDETGVGRHHIGAVGVRDERRRLSEGHASMIAGFAVAATGREGPRKREVVSENRLAVQTVRPRAADIDRAARSGKAGEGLRDARFLVRFLDDRVFGALSTTDLRHMNYKGFETLNREIDGRRCIGTLTQHSEPMELLDTENGQILGANGQALTALEVVAEDGGVIL